MASGLRIGLSMGINGDDPRTFAALASDLGFNEIVVNHQFHEDPATIRHWKAIFDEAVLFVFIWGILHLNDAKLTETTERNAAILQINRGFSDLADLYVLRHAIARLPSPVRQAYDRQALDLT